MKTLDFLWVIMPFIPSKCLVVSYDCSTQCGESDRANHVGASRVEAEDVTNQSRTGGRLRNKNKIPSGNETWQWKIRHIGKSLINGPFSIAIFDYQRVSLPITEAVSFLHQVCDESTSQMPPLPRNRSIPGLSTKQAIL